MISHPLRRCSSVVSTLPRPILITVRPHNFVCVRYARPDALIRSTMSLLIASMPSKKPARPRAGVAARGAGAAAPTLEPAHIQHAEIQRHKNGLMRIDHDGVGQLPAFGYPVVLRQHGESAAVRSVDVQPHFFLPANLCDLRNAIDACGRSRSNGCDDRHRLKTALPIVRDTAA